MKLLHRLHPGFSKFGAAAMLVASVFAVRTAWATPYASYVTNSAGTIKFYLNEGGANVTVTYEDGTTNANFNGITQGTNTPAGQTNFLLGSHTSYAISVTKLGSGTPSLIKSLALTGNPRGVDVNKNPASPYFGRIYEVNGGGSPAGVYLLNPDMTYTVTNVARAGGVTSFGSGGTGPGQSPYRLSVAADDGVIVGDASLNGAGVYRIDPTFTTNQFVLGPLGITNGSVGVHGSIQSRPLLVGSLAQSNAVLYQIDGTLSPFNAIQVYNIGAGPLPWTNPPSYTAYQVGIALDAVTLGGNENPGLTRGPNGYLYCSTYRLNLSNPIIQVYSADGLTNLWNSWTPDQTPYAPPSGNGTPGGDYFLRSINGITQAMVDSAVSGDGNYIAACDINNGVIVCPLTNGIPNPANLFTVTPTATTGNARGIAWDAANNYYLSSSGLGALQQWSLGITATAITKGNATGQTNYSLLLPSTSVSVVATTPAASQTGPTPGVFTITRTDAGANYSTPVKVNYTITGTAFNITNYTISPATATNSIIIAAGMTSTNITITPVVDSIARPTTTVILTVIGGSQYTTTVPFKDTVFIQNTAPDLVFVSSVVTPTMYKGLTNDFASFVVTRYGDTNAASFSVSGFTYGGTAVSNVAYLPAAPITFDPGVVSITNYISPFIDTTNYVGNKTVVIGLTAGAGYTAGTNLGTVTILDNAFPPATLIYANPLTDPNDVTNWNLTAANNNMVNNGIDNNVDFGYDLSANNPNAGLYGLIPMPPSGATKALRVSVNKNSGAGSGAAAGVNLYLTNLFLTGDYAIRFSMDIVEGSSASTTTEGPLFGINHSGLKTNWWTGSGITSGGPSWTSDGIWYWLSADGGASAGDFIEYTGAGGTNGNAGFQTLGTKARASFTGVFKNPSPYSSTASGVPANNSPANALGLGVGYTNGWANVEIKTASNVVTMSINKTVIYTYTNTTVWTNGNIMLGYNDPFSSVGGPDGAVYFSDLKVYRLAPPVITLQPTNVVVGVGTNAVFAVAVSFGTTSVNTNGQWSYNGTPIAGATNYVLTVLAAKTNYGTYTWAVNDGTYTIVSAGAQLIPPAPVIVTPPANVIAAVTGSATFSFVPKTFSGTTNYQWYTNSVAIGGATSATLTLNALAASSFALNYTVGLNDGVTTVTSTPAANLIPATVPTISSPGVLTGGKFRLSLTSQVGPSYVVGFKTNLLQSTWLLISTNAGTGGIINVTNSTATNSQGYYLIQLK